MEAKTEPDSQWIQWDTHQAIRPTDLSRTPSLAHHPRPVTVSSTETDDTVQVSSQTLKISIQKTPWSLSITDIHDNLIVKETPILPSNPPDAPNALYGSLAFRLDVPQRVLWRKYYHLSQAKLWFHATSIQSWEEHERGIEIIANTNDLFDRKLTVNITFLDDAIFQIHATVSDTTALIGFAHSFETAHDELFYGLGERFTACNQYGQEVLAWSSAGPTGRRDWTYWPQPFVMTGSHYGILFDTTYRNRFRLCSDYRGKFAFETEGPELAYYFIYDPDPMNIIEGLTDLVGKPPLPPKWSFGVLRNINGSEANVRAEAKKLREANIPCSALWYYDSLDEDRHIAWPINHMFYDGDYDDVPQLNRDLKKLGYNAQTYLFPYMYAGTKNFEEGDKHGYFAKNKRGDTYRMPFHTVDYEKRFPTQRLAGIIDFTNPEAVAWYQEIIRQIIIELDFDGWMHDFSEDVPPDAIFSNGKTGAEIHNIYPVLYKKATYEACMRHKPEVSYYARAGYAGSQGYTMALWTGDQIINWSYDDGLPSVIAGSLNLGFCGCPYIGPDIAGYFHGDNFPSIVSEELWIRWLQLGSITPVMRDLIAHYPIELWTSDQTVEAFRTYSRLHMSLFPYFYTYAHLAHERGLPIMRHLYLLYPDDINVRNLDYQFLLGNEILVAPVGQPNVEEWSVYFPEGEWISWWDGAHYQGKQHVDVPAPLMQLPLFARAGAIIPQLPSDVDTLVPAQDESVRVANDDLVIDVFPSTNPITSQFQLYNGTQFSWDSIEQAFTITNSPVTRTYIIRMRGLQSADSVTLSGSDGQASGLAWETDTDYQCLSVEFTGTDGVVRFK